MSYHHWQYFLAIESDLAATCKYVEFSENNYSSYSLEFARILLSSSSEIDVVAKALCRKIDGTKNYGNIDDYRNKITQTYRKLHTVEVSIPRYGLSVKPWEAWGGDKNPNWWKSYNDVKHQRDAHFEKACLKNSLLSVGGLFVLVLYFYKEQLGKPDFFWPSFPKLMLLPGAPDLIWHGDWKLPDD